MAYIPFVSSTAPKQPAVPVAAQPPVQQQQQQQPDYRIAQPVPSIPTPPNLTPDLERGLNPPSQPPSPPQQQAQRPQPQPQPARQPSPSRKSMFEFASPFDVLAASSSGPRKKPVPPLAPSNAGLSSGPDDPPSPGPAPAAQDPRRKSVENLLEGLTKPLPEPKPKAAAAAMQPQPQQKASPRASPPRTLAQRPPLRSSEASSLAHIAPAAPAPAGRERGSSPAPRAGNNAGAGGQWQPQPQGQGKGAGRGGKKQAAPAPAAYVVPSRMLRLLMALAAQSSVADDCVRRVAGGRRDARNERHGQVHGHRAAQDRPNFCAGLHDRRHVLGRLRDDQRCADQCGCRLYVTCAQVA